MAKGDEKLETKPEDKPKYILTLSSTIPSETVANIEKHIYESAWNVSVNCDACMRRQESGENIPEITESNISLAHMVRMDARELAAMARIYCASSLEDDAIKFSKDECGYNKDKCIAARRSFSSTILYEIKRALDYSKEQRKISN